MLEKSKQQDLDKVSRRFERQELGQVEASERSQEILSLFDSKVADLRAVFAAGDPAQHKAREVPDHLIDMITFEVRMDG